MENRRLWTFSNEIDGVGFNAGLEMLEFGQGQTITIKIPLHLGSAKMEKYLQAKEK